MKQNDITLDDLLVLVDEFLEIKKLEENYKTNYLNRKECAAEINSRIEKFRKLGESFEDILRDNAPSIFRSDAINLNLAYNIILRLANQNEDKYVMEKIYVSSIAALHDKNDEINDGVVYVIGDKRILDSINNKKKYHIQSFSKGTAKAIEAGNSIIAFGKRYSDYNITPGIVNDKFSIVTLKVSGFFNDIIGYICDDELGRSFMKLKEFIEVNGADIEDIPIDILCDYISKQEGKIRPLKNKKER